MIEKINKYLVLRIEINNFVLFTLNNRNMKKTVLMKIDVMSIFLLLLFFLSGCQSERKNNYDQKQTAY